MTPKEQLKQWVQGNSIHNHERDECCPDFSCCRGKKFMANKNTREKFAKAFEENDHDTMYKMLTMFLGISLQDENVYIDSGEKPKIFSH